MPPAPSARLLFPRPDLSACVFMGVERDTRGTALSDGQRFNYYPATPMSLVSWIFEGTLHMVEERSGDGRPVLGPPLPRLVLSGPQRRPVASWSPGPVHALSVAFYPDALARLTGIGAESLVDRILPLEEAVSGPLPAACRSLLAPDAAGDPFDRLQACLQPLWSGPHPREASIMPLMGDWLRTLAVRAALSRAGRGVHRRSAVSSRGPARATATCSSSPASRTWPSAPAGAGTPAPWTSPGSPATPASPTSRTWAAPSAA